MTGAEAAAIAGLAFGASVVQSATGLGFGLLIIPPLILVIGVKDAVVVSNVLSTALSGMLLTRVHGSVTWGTAGVLFAAACAGMPIGLLVLVFAEPRLLQVVIAAGVIVFSVLLARGLRLAATGRGWEIFTGLLSGVLRTSTSMSGPPVIILLQGRALEASRFRATITAYFVAGGVVSVGLFAVARRLDGDVLTDIAIALPAVFAGLLTGSALYRRTNEVLFRRAVLAILFVSAAIALGGAVVG